MFCAGWQKMSLKCSVEEVARERKGEPENVILRNQEKEDTRREQSIAFNATEKAEKCLLIFWQT